MTKQLFTFEENKQYYTWGKDLNKIYRLQKEFENEEYYESEELSDDEEEDITIGKFWGMIGSLSKDDNYIAEIKYPGTIPVELNSDLKTWKINKFKIGKIYPVEKIYSLHREISEYIIIEQNPDMYHFLPEKKKTKELLKHLNRFYSHYQI